MQRLMIIALASGLVCAFVAREKLRSPVAWFLIGTLLPGLSLLVVLFLPDIPTREARKRMRGCPHCERMIPAVVDRCDCCGEAVEPAEIVVRPRGRT